MAEKLTLLPSSEQHRSVSKAQFIGDEDAVSASDYGSENMTFCAGHISASARHRALLWLAQPAETFWLTQGCTWDLAGLEANSRPAGGSGLVPVQQGHLLSAPATRTVDPGFRCEDNERELS